MDGYSPDDEVKVKKPFPPKRVAPRSKEERGDDREEMVDDALVHTKLSNSVLRRDDDDDGDDNGDDDDDDDDDNGEEMINDALIHTKLSNSVLSTARFQN